MKIGILLLIAANKENIFSNKALFSAIPLSNFIFFTMNFSSCKGKSKKLFNLKQSYFLRIEFIFPSSSFLCSLFVILI